MDAIRAKLNAVLEQDDVDLTEKEKDGICQTLYCPDQDMYLMLVEQALERRKAKAEAKRKVSATENQEAFRAAEAFRASFAAPHHSFGAQFAAARQ